MKTIKRRRAVALSVVMALATACTATPALAKDPCATFMCMAGKLQGDNLTDSCTGPISDYFSILSYHHGHIDWSATPKDRLSFMKSCPGGDPSKMNSITGAFGSASG